MEMLRAVELLFTQPLELTAAWTTRSHCRCTWTPNVPWGVSRFERSFLTFTTFQKPKCTQHDTTRHITAQHPAGGEGKQLQLQCLGWSSYFQPERRSSTAKSTSEFETQWAHISQESSLGMIARLYPSWHCYWTRVATSWRPHSALRRQIQVELDLQSHVSEEKLPFSIELWVPCSIPSTRQHEISSCL